MVGNQVSQQNSAMNTNVPQVFAQGFSGSTLEVQTLKAVFIQNNKWQFIVTSFDPNGEVRTYIDGTPVAIITGLPTSACPSETSVWTIGGTAPGSAISYNGKIDNMTIYYGSLSPTQVSFLYEKGRANHPLATR